MFRIGGRFDRARADMAERAGHADAVRADQVLVVVIAGIGVVTHGIPFLGGGCIEGGIRKETETDNTGRPSIVRADGQVVTARANPHAGIFRFVFEWIGRAIRIALVEPQAVALRIGPGRLDETGLVHQPKISPAIVAGILEAGMGGERLEKIERAKTGDGERIPKAIVAAGPDQPHVAAFDLLGGQRQTAVHVVKVIFAGGGEGGRRRDAHAKLRPERYPDGAASGSRPRETAAAMRTRTRTRLRANMPGTSNALFCLDTQTLRELTTGERSASAMSEHHALARNQAVKDVSRTTGRGITLGSR